MNTLQNQPQKSSVPKTAIVDLLHQIGSAVLKDGLHAEWLDIPGAVHVCKENGFRLGDRTFNESDLELSLREAFKEGDEICANGITTLGYDRRVGWDTVFQLRFYRFKPVSVSLVAAIDTTKSELSMVTANQEASV